MRKLQTQAGLTAIGFILILIPVGFLIYAVLKVAPVYIEAFSVGDALQSLKKEPDIRERTQNDIYTLIQKRLEVNNIRSIKKEDVKIVKTVNDITVKVEYEARVPLIANIDLMMSFHKSTLIR
jgi:hypothetical protein